MKDQKLSNNRKIIITTEYAFSNQNSTGYYWSKIIDKIELTYQDLIVICRTPDEPLCHSAHNYKYISIKPYELKGLKKRLLSQIRMSIDFIYQIYRLTNKGDIIITGTNPIMLIILFPILRRLIKFKWILLVHDVFPNYLIPYKIVKNEMWYRFLNFISKPIYTNSDAIITIGRDMDKLIKSKSCQVKNSHIIQNWASTDEVSLISKNNNKYIKKLHWENFIVFGFFGNIGYLQGIKNILNAIEVVKNKKASFLFIGDGNLVNTVENFIKTHPNINVAYGGPLSMKEKEQGLSACDVAIISLEPQMLGVGVPSKAYFSMAADKPLLAVVEYESEISQMVLEEQIGWQCNPGDPVKLATLIDSICEIDISHLKGKPRKIIEEKYSEEKTLDKIMSIIEDMR